MTDPVVQRSVRHSSALLQERSSGAMVCGPAPVDSIRVLAVRVRAEYEEMPGLHLTVLQAARLFGVSPGVAHAVLDDLRRATVLKCSDRGMYSLSR